MSESQPHQEHRERAGQAFEVLIRLGIVFLLLVWGMQIVAPFIHPLTWGVILAVALYPAFQRLCRLLGDRTKLAGTLFIVGAIALVVVPIGGLAAGSMDGVLELAGRWQAGELKVPPPTADIRDLPVIGDRVY